MAQVGKRGATRSIPAHASLNTVLDLLSGHAIVRSIAVVAELRIRDFLADGPKSAAELAHRCGVSEDALQRLLRALAAIDFFTETPSPVRYGLTSLSEWLRTDIPNSLRDFARLRGGEMYWKAWGALHEVMKTGGVAFQHAHGMSHFDYLDRHPEAGRLFHAGMQSFLTQIQAAVIEAYDFSRFRKLIDVGGGTGGFLAAILQANPRLHGILFDLPPAIERSADILRAAGVLERCERVAGDFFSAVPTGADAAFISRVLHDFDDDEVLTILRNCRAALPRGGKIIIVEFVLSDGPSGRAAKLFDLQMLVYFGGGRERSAEEFRALLDHAGFSLSGITETAVSMAILEGTAAA